MTEPQETTHAREQRGQPFPNRWSQGCKKQTRQYYKDKSETFITNRIHKRSTVYIGNICAAFRTSETTFNVNGGYTLQLADDDICTCKCAEPSFCEDAYYK